MSGNLNLEALIYGIRVDSINQDSMIIINGLHIPADEEIKIKLEVNNIIN